MAGLVIAAAAGAGLLGWALSDGGGAASSASLFPSTAKSGVVMSWSELGTLLDSGPDGRQTSSLRGFGQFKPQGPPSVSPRGGLVAFSDGQIVATGTAKPVPFNDHLALGEDEVLPPLGNAFSGGSRYVIVLTEGRFGNPTTTAGISVVNLQTGTSTPLGTGNTAAGDPRQPGAFVTVASPLRANAGNQNFSTQDSKLELVDASRPVMVLASAASLDRDLGLGPSTPVSVVPVPSPSGALVAAEVVNLLDVTGADAGLVVLDRSGKVVAVQDPRLGPSSGTVPVWSPDGAAIAYVNEANADNSIEVWTVGAGTVRVHLRTGVGAGQCLWSPTGAAVLCDSARPTAGGVDITWSVTDVSGGPEASLPGPGFVIDWFRG